MKEFWVYDITLLKLYLTKVKVQSLLFGFQRQIKSNR